MTHDVSTPRPVRDWIETLALTTLGLAFALYRNGDEQVLSTSVAAWLVLLPVLSGAQHGMAHGLVSSLLICVAAIRIPLAADGGEDASSALYNWAFVYVGVGAIVGLCRDVAERRVSGLRQQTRAQAEQVQRLERALHTLRMSHGQLEQRFCTQPSSLESVLDGAIARMRDLGSGRELGELMLEVLSSRASLQAASLFVATTHGALPEPLAALGAAVGGTYDHPFVARAALTRRMITVADPVARAHATPGVLAALPLSCSAGHLRFVLAIHQMPFDAFQLEQLRNLYALAARLTDLVHDRLRALNGQHMPLVPAPSHASGKGKRRNGRRDSGSLWLD
jgi:hypothetical protein